MKIEKLTKEQEELMIVYRDKWIKLGLSTDRFTQEEAQQWANYFYENIRKKPKVPVIVAQSPLAAWVIVNLFAFAEKGYKLPLKNIPASVRDSVWTSVGTSVRNSVWASVRDSVGDSVWASVGTSVRDSVRASVRASVRDFVEDSVRDSVRASVWASVWDSVEDSVRASVRASVRDFVEDSVRDSVEDSVRASVWASVEDSVRASVWDSVRASVRDFVEDSVEVSQFINYISPYFEGSFDANIWGFYNYFNEVLNINYDKVQRHYDWWCSTVKFGQIFPLDNVCIISQKPIEINQSGTKLHADGKPAVRYADGFSVWALNGVRVPQYLAETPASSLDIEFFKKEQNADIKAEFIRKYGIERMVSMGKLIDTWENHEGTNNFEWYKKSEYKIIDMSPIFTTYDYLPYLKMRNQTIPEIYHLECVYNPNKTKQPTTILEGLEVRLGFNPENMDIINIK